MALPVPGDVFDGRFRVERKLGEGGFATVFLAMDGGRQVALKVLHRPTGGYDAGLVARADREVAILGQLNSPHIVEFVAAGTSDSGLRYLVFEYAPGVDLSDLLAQRIRLEPDEVATILSQVLAGLETAHRAGMIHRDIKPQNIRVVSTAPLRVKILDFGIARSTAPDAGPSVTATGELVGTLQYMAPEQLTDKPLSAATDIYSLGVVGFELLLGSHAIHGAELGDQFDRLRTGHLFAPPSEGGHRVWAVVERMTRKSPSERYPSCRAALDDLNEVAAREVPRAASPESPGGFWSVGVLAALFVACVVLLLWPDSTDEVPPRRLPAALNKVRPELTVVRPTIVADVGSPKSADVRPVDSAPTYVPDPSAGCLAPGSRVLDTEAHKISAGFPADFDPERPHPLVIFLHDDFVPPTKVLLAPAVTTSRDAGSTLWVAPWHRRARQLIMMDELRKTWRDRDRSRKVIEHARDWAFENQCVDKRRVYVIGHGFGGRAANTLACESWITAIGVFGTATRLDGHDSPPHCPDGPRPMVWMHPMSSPRAPTDGGVGCHDSPVTGLEEQRRIMRDRHQCDGDWELTSESRDGRCRTMSCVSPMEFCEVAGGSVWPELEYHPAGLGLGLDCVDTAVTDFPVAAEMLRFFGSVPPLDRP